jgi:hypothetical protein
MPHRSAAIPGAQHAASVCVSIRPRGGSLVDMTVAGRRADLACRQRTGVQGRALEAAATRAGADLRQERISRLGASEARKLAMRGSGGWVRRAAWPAGAGASQADQAGIGATNGAPAVMVSLTHAGAQRNNKTGCVSVHYRACVFMFACLRPVACSASLARLRLDAIITESMRSL